MIVSHRHRFIFIKSRKTAGSSIQVALSQLCGEADFISGAGVNRNSLGRGKVNSNTPAAAVRKLVGEETWKSYFKFVFIRNPWDLTVSRYFYDMQKGRHNIQDFNVWVRRVRRSTWTGDNLHSYSHIDDELVADFVGRYENLAADFEMLCGHLGIPVTSLGHEKKRHVKRAPYTDYYDETSRKIVATKQQMAIRFFGYSF